MVIPTQVAFADHVDNLDHIKDAGKVQKEQGKTSAIRSVLAGSTAGAVEIAITYPFEFAKTRVQLNQRRVEAERVPWPKFPSREWYAGCTTMIVGNAVKAGVRFVAYDAFRQSFAVESERISSTQILLAGLGAGVFESIFAVTPFECIKTQLVDDRKRPSPRMRGFIHGALLIFRERGLPGWFQGLVATTARQAANSAVRFGAYGTIREQFDRRARSRGEKVGTVETFTAGALAGAVTVYVTMPVDTVKTRMQSLNARKLYSSTLGCAVSILRHEGVLALWSGALPRLGRLILSGGIVFSVYEKMMALMDSADPYGRYL